MASGTTDPDALLVSGTEAREPHYLGIACLFRDSVFYLREWIEYHRIMGVTRFYLCDHMSSDGATEVLMPYVASGLATLVRCNRDFDADFEGDIHVPFFNAAIAAARGEVRWLACLDSDEFMIASDPQRDPTLLSIFERHEQTPPPPPSLPTLTSPQTVASKNVAVNVRSTPTPTPTEIAKPAVPKTPTAVLAMNWRMFGTSRVKKIPQGKLILETLTRCASPSDHENSTLKMVVRPALVGGVDHPHTATAVSGSQRTTCGYPTRNEPFSPKPDIAEIALNHYNTGDEDYFEKIKVPFYNRYIAHQDVRERVTSRAKKAAFCESSDAGGISSRHELMDRIRAERFAAPPRVCVIMHAGNPEEWEFYRRYLFNLYRADVPFDMYVTVHEAKWVDTWGETIKTFHRACGGKGARPVEFIKLAENKGMDTGPWLITVHYIATTLRISYDHVLKVHTKTMRHKQYMNWRVELMNAVAGSPNRVKECIARLSAKSSRVHMLGAAAWRYPSDNRVDVARIELRLGLGPYQPAPFIAGTIFWARWDQMSEPLAKSPADMDAFLASCPEGYSHVENESHMIERVLGRMAVGTAGDPNVILGISDPVPLDVPQNTDITRRLAAIAHALNPKVWDPHLVRDMEIRVFGSRQPQRVPSIRALPHLTQKQKEQPQSQSHLWLQSQLPLKQGESDQRQEQKRQQQHQLKLDDRSSTLWLISSRFSVNVLGAGVPAVATTTGTITNINDCNGNSSTTTGTSTGTNNIVSQSPAEFLPITAISNTFVSHASTASRVSDCASVAAATNVDNVLHSPNSAMAYPFYSLIQSGDSKKSAQLRKRFSITTTKSLSASLPSSQQSQSPLKTLSSDETFVKSTTSSTPVINASLDVASTIKGSSGQAPSSTPTPTPWPLIDMHWPLVPSTVRPVEAKEWVLALHALRELASRNATIAHVIGRCTSKLNATKESADPRAPINDVPCNEISALALILGMLASRVSNPYDVRFTLVLPKVSEFAESAGYAFKAGIPFSRMVSVPESVPNHDMVVVDVRACGTYEIALRCALSAQSWFVVLLADGGGTVGPTPAAIVDAYANVKRLVIENPEFVIEPVIGAPSAMIVVRRTKL